MNEAVDVKRRKREKEKKITDKVIVSRKKKTYSKLKIVNNARN